VAEVAPVILDVARDVTALAEKLAEPRVVFVTSPVERVTPESLTVRGGPTFHGRCFWTHASGAREAVGFVLTLGPAVDERIAELADGGELLEALFLDTASWLAIEDALRAFRSHLRGSWRARGRRLTPRLGPGYVDWPLTEQADLFTMFAGADLPVRLSEYCVMTPCKSISGLFGLVPAA
jgi:hypothetical protein